MCQICDITFLENEFTDSHEDQFWKRKENKSPRLKNVLPIPSKVAFRNDISLKNKLVTSKPVRQIVKPNKRDSRNHECSGNLCQICHIIFLENEFNDIDKSLAYKKNFDFDSSSQFVIYLIAYKVCQKQYFGSTITSFRKQLITRYKTN